MFHLGFGLIIVEEGWMPVTVLAERIAHHLGSQIVNGELAAGEVLRLELLAEQFEVSRPVIRESVKLLESHALVSSRRRVGVTVQPSQRWHHLSPFVLHNRLQGPERVAALADISQLRRGVEPVAASLAAQRQDPAHCTRLTESAAGMKRTGLNPDSSPIDLAEYLEYDVEFHRSLLKASGNPLMAALADVVSEVLAARTHHQLMPDIPNPAAVKLHVEVARAVTAGDRLGAFHAMTAIVDEAEHAMMTMATQGHDMVGE